MDDVQRVLTSRGLRGFADGFVSVLLSLYLIQLGFSPLQIGAIITGTLIGSALLTLAVGLSAHRLPLRTLLIAAGGLMAATGLGFLAFTTFWLLLAVAVVGTLNPSAGDVSVFLPTEQAFLADFAPATARTRLYARYNLVGVMAGAFGALASSAPEPVSQALGCSLETAQRLGFLVYIGAAVAITLLYRGLRHGTEERASADGRGPLATSRRIVLELSALFCLDAAGGGFVVQSLLVLWLHLRFNLSPGVTGAVFFVVSVLAASSQLLAARLAERIGLVRTMVFTHLPANGLLILAAIVPNEVAAIGLLFARSFLSQMDVPARQAFVMAVVPPAERAAAASVTNVPRSLASALTPFLAGWMLSRTDFGWPLIIGGLMKASYDLLLLVLYRNVPVEEGARRTPRPARAPIPAPFED